MSVPDPFWYPALSFLGMQRFPEIKPFSNTVIGIVCEMDSYLPNFFTSAIAICLIGFLCGLLGLSCLLHRL